MGNLRGKIHWMQEWTRIERDGNKGKRIFWNNSQVSGTGDFPGYTVPSLDTQNTGEEAGLDGGKGKDEGGKEGQ